MPKTKDPMSYVATCTFALTLHCSEAVEARRRYKLKFVRAKMQSAKHKVHFRILFFLYFLATVKLNWGCWWGCVSKRKGDLSWVWAFHLYSTFLGRTTPSQCHCQPQCNFPLPHHADGSKREREEVQKRGKERGRVNGRVDVKSLRENSWKWFKCTLLSISMYTKCLCDAHTILL